MSENPTNSAGVPPPRTSAWPDKRLRASRGLRIGNSVVSILTHWGLVPHTYVMTTRGRKTGDLHSTPVTLAERDWQKWLVAPYGPVQWVLNARVAGRVSLRRRGRVGMYAVHELPAADAGPILKQYLRIAGATTAYFSATTQSPVEDFIAEANKHPVFALTAVRGPHASR